MKQKTPKFKYDIYLTDKVNGIKITQPGQGCTTAVSALSKGFLTLSKKIKPNTFKFRILVKEVDRNANVLDTGVIHVYDQTKV